MQTVTAMEFRRHLGAYLDEVRLKSASIILERAGKPVAMLTPVRSSNVAPALARRLRAVHELTGINPTSTRAADIDSWLQTERECWN